MFTKKIVQHLTKYASNEKWWGIFDGIENYAKNKITETQKNFDAASEKLNVINETLKLITDAQNSTIPKVNMVYKMLRETGAISYNLVALGRRWLEWSWYEWVKAVLESLKNAFNPGKPIKIVVYSKWTYKAIDMVDYDKQVWINPGQFNYSLAYWLFQLYKWGFKSPYGLRPETWEKLAIYIHQRGWKSNILQDMSDQDIQLLKDIYASAKAKIEQKMSESIKTVGLSKEVVHSKEFQQKLQSIQIKINKDGIPDIQEFIESKKWKTFEEITQWIRYIIQKTDHEIQNIKNIINETKEKTWITDLTTINDLGIEEKDFQDKAFYRTIKNRWEGTIGTLEELKMLRGELQRINEKIYNSKVENEPKNRKIIAFIWIILQKEAIKWYQSNKVALGVTMNEVEKAKKLGKTFNQFKESLWDSKFQEKTTMAIAIWDQRSTIEDTAEYLKKFWIHNLQEAQEKIKDLNEKREQWIILTQDEIKLLSALEAYRKQNIKISELYVASTKSFWKGEAQEIFQTTNELITGKKETIAFNSFEKIITITDPESTWITSKLYNLNPGSWEKIIIPQSENTWMLWKEFSIYATKLENGKIIIVNKAWKAISQEKLNPEQVESFSEEIRFLQAFWLEKLIPEIGNIHAMITNKLWYKVNGLDTTFWYQEALKILQIFWKILFSQYEMPNNMRDIKEIWYDHMYKWWRLSRESIDHALEERGILDQNNNINRIILEKTIQEL